MMAGAMAAASNASNAGNASNASNSSHAKRSESPPQSQLAKLDRLVFLDLAKLFFQGSQTSSAQS